METEGIAHVVNRGSGEDNIRATPVKARTTQSQPADASTQSSNAASALDAARTRITESRKIADDVKEIELPSGRIAKVRKAFGRDFMNAQRSTKLTDPIAIIYALMAEVSLIDDKPFTYEEVLDMPLPDVLAIQKEVAGENFSQPAVSRDQKI